MYAVYVFDADIETVSVQQTLAHQRHNCARDRRALEDVLDESFFLASDANTMKISGNSAPDKKSY